MVTFSGSLLVSVVMLLFYRWYGRIKNMIYGLFIIVCLLIGLAIEMEGFGSGRKQSKNSSSSKDEIFENHIEETEETEDPYSL